MKWQYDAALELWHAQLTIVDMRARLQAALAELTPAGENGA